MVVDPSKPIRRSSRATEAREVSRAGLYVSVASLCAAIVAALVAVHHGRRAFASVLSVGTAAAALVACRTLRAPRGQYVRAVAMAGAGACPDTHVRHGRACALAATHLQYGGVRYALDKSTDRTVCLDATCRQRMGPIRDLHALDDAQVARVCAMFKGRPFAKLTALDARCPR